MDAMALPIPTHRNHPSPPPGRHPQVLFRVVWIPPHLSLSGLSGPWVNFKGVNLACSGRRKVIGGQLPQGGVLWSSFGLLQTLLRAFRSVLQDFAGGANFLGGLGIQDFILCIDLEITESLTSDVGWFCIFLSRHKHVNLVFLKSCFFAKPCLFLHSIIAYFSRSLFCQRFICCSWVCFIDVCFSACCNWNLETGALLFAPTSIWGTFLPTWPRLGISMFWRVVRPKKSVIFVSLHSPALFEVLEYSSMARILICSFFQKQGILENFEVFKFLKLLKNRKKILPVPTPLWILKLITTL